MERLARSPLMFALMVLLVLGEWFWRCRVARLGYDGGGALTSVTVGLGHAVVGVLSARVLGGVFLALARVAPVHWSMRDGRVWLVAFLAVELVYYLVHRASHTMRWMWATHAVHHTPEQMTLLSAIRLGWTHLLSLGWAGYLPLLLVGFDPRMVFALLAFNLHYQFFLHTEAVGSVGPLEWVLNTPAHHRVHHGSNAAYLDCNYGGVLIVFDRLFGTLRTERADDPVRYGLANPLGTLNPLRLVFQPWRQLIMDMRATGSVGGALKIAFGRP